MNTSFIFGRSKSWASVRRGARLLAVPFASALAFVPNTAHACGGFFCNASQPVNQAAEGIIFADNGDGTVTAVIQIQYEGPSESFSWLLPIPTAPAPGALKVASDLAFARLKQLTNPQYTLTTRVEGNCKTELQVALSDAPGSVAKDSSKPSVRTVSEGSVGPFDWSVIAVEPGTSEPATAAVDWLRDNMYDVPSGTVGLLKPYLDDNLLLLALRLTKGKSTGSIRPIALTYAATKAMIPVKLTAVAANPDMGVLTWLLGNGRGVPENYNALTLNEARINWFNANSNYNDVVNEAADDAGGHGFVTEFAGDPAPFKNNIWSQAEEQQWESLQIQLNQSDRVQLVDVFGLGSLDGFWDAIEPNLELPQDTTLQTLKDCPYCAGNLTVEVQTSGLAERLEADVVAPMRLVQNLVNRFPKLTRLYTTLSPEDMTVDPLFTFNKTLPDVSNLHTAMRVIECTSSVLQRDASWRIELPQGSVVRGQAQSLSWPSKLSSVPANLRIEQLSAVGSGKVLEDNAEPTATLLAEYNATIPPSKDGCDCRLVAGRDRPGTWWLAVALGASALGRLRRRGRKEA